MNVDIGAEVKHLHPLEIRVLRWAAGAADNSKREVELRTEILISSLAFNVGQCNQVFSWLTAKGLVEEKERMQRTFYELTERGREFQEVGTPYERLAKTVRERGPLALTEIAAELELDNKDIGSAFGLMSKEGVVAMDGEKRVTLKLPDLSPHIRTIRALLDRAAQQGAIEESSLTASELEILQSVSKKRGAGSAPFRVAEREEVAYRMTAEGLELARRVEEQGLTGEEIGALTPAMLASGEWKGKAFRRYNIQTPPARLIIGRRNPYAEYLQWVKDKLVSLGFEEFDGPLVETEFWNGDALFMPQFHSARDIHDVYYVAAPERATEIEQPWLDRVAEAHENGGDTGSRGWGYSFDRDFTRKLILRSQGTVLSAKQLPKAKIPGKYFGIVRCFRYDQVDATHGADFYQTEGIVLGEDVNLRTLLGLLKMFAEEVAGATEVKYVPGYFPFTEPSIEVHIKHPDLGWFELGGSGIFRPEVTRPLGIEVPVLAWGLGIDRMALLHLGLSDLRELFTGNIENVRQRKRK